MTYVISDLHGYPLEKLKKLLEKAHFSSSDFLFILGDVIDRNGDGGIATLCWLIRQPNAQLILGNHEAMLLSCRFILDEVTNESLQSLTAQKLEQLNNYMLNGGTVTLFALRTLGKKDRAKIFDYLADAPLYEAVSAGGKDFLLVHAGLENFSPTKKITQYTEDELLWAYPEESDRYFDSIMTIFGHTPTMSYNKKYTGKILKTETWIDIDVGAAYGQPPVLLRLEDLKEFRADT